MKGSLPVATLIHKRHSPRVRATINGVASALPFRRLIFEEEALPLPIPER
ncbi:hypothetical protein [Luteibacter rhizovicinus]|nr:hypothetical protein [Luteibacter rhizovicinus]